MMKFYDNLMLALDKETQRRRITNADDVTSLCWIAIFMAVVYSIFPAFKPESTKGIEHKKQDRISDN